MPFRPTQGNYIGTLTLADLDSRGRPHPYGVPVMIPKETFNEPKPWYTSKTVWGGLIAVAGAGAAAAGYTLVPDDMEQLAQILATIGAGVGGILAIVGRVTAKRKIGP